MTPPTIPELSHALILRSELSSPGEFSALRKRVLERDLTRIDRGVYIETAYWVALDGRHQYLCRIAASARLTEGEHMFSHESAAALWQLPWIGAWPTRVHELHDRADGGRSTKLVARHSVGIPATNVRIEGLNATELARTVVDLATRLGFGPGVAIADAALRRTANPVAALPRTTLTQATLLAELARVPMRHGSAHARRTIQFADGRADRPGESLSRVTMFRAGIPAPQLQVRLYGASGRRYFVDFWWPQFGVIGEFDGKGKYKDPEFLNGRTPEQALADEKKREDDLRLTRKSFARWGWNEASSIPLLQERLRNAGVR